MDGAAEQAGYGPVSRPETAGEAFMRAIAEDPPQWMMRDLQRIRGERLAWALWWAEARGLDVFPVEIGGKRPVVPHGFKSGTRDRRRIADWFGARFPGHNIGARTGAPGPDVLDVEGCGKPGGDGWAAFGRLKAAGLLAGAHRIVRTPSGGLHVYFAGTAQRGASLRAAGLDFKATGGYVLVPPSKVGGRPYELVDERPATGAGLDWQACVRLLAPRRPVPVRTGSYRRGPGSATHLVEWLEGEYEGNRNNGLFWACCRALEAGDDDVLDELMDVAVAAGLDENEALRTAASAVRTVDGGW